jgi:putative transposase
MPQRRYPKWPGFRCSVVAGFGCSLTIERLWRSVKYEEVYLNDYDCGEVAYDGLARYFGFYNTERPHQALSYRTPEEVYAGL